jgi:hypothetical protein
VLVAGCGASPPRRVDVPLSAEPPRPCPSRIPLGDPADYAPPPPVAALAVAPLQRCDAGAYVRVERTIGARRVGTARRHDGGFAEGCASLPADPRDPTQGPVLNPGAILGAVAADLRAAHVEVTRGGGLGPCGDSRGDYAAWNFAVAVRSWADLATAQRALADVLERYDVRGFLGVGVAGVACVQFE